MCKESLTAFKNFELLCGADLEADDSDGGRIRIDTPRGHFVADFVICGIGVEIDLATRAELKRIAPLLRTWADAFTPPPGEGNDRLLCYPYLGSDQELVERAPGSAP